jgi:hypoxanthine phosphoribosyltransferase
MAYANEVEVLISADALRERVTALGEAITQDYAGRELVLVCVLKGSFMFCADLVRAIDLPLAIEFLGVKSYDNAQTSSGVVQIISDLARPIENKHVLIVEDIIDTGLTMQYLRQVFDTRRPASIKVCALLHKPSRRRVPAAIDYLGFEIDDVFAVGYGLDWAQRYRNLPFVGVVRQTEETSP